MYSDIQNGLLVAQDYLTKYFNKGSKSHYGAMLFDPRVKNMVYTATNWENEAYDLKNS